MVTDCLNIYRMKAFSVYKVVLIRTWCLDSDVGAIKATDNVWEASLLVKTFFDFKLLPRRTWPFYKMVVLCSKQSGNTSDNSRHRTFWNHSNCVTYYLEKTPASKKTKSNQNLLFCQQCVVSCCLPLKFRFQEIGKIL